MIGKNLSFTMYAVQISYLAILSVSNAIFSEDLSKAKDTRFVASGKVLLCMRSLF